MGDKGFVDPNDFAAKFTLEWCLLADWKDALRSGKYRQTRNMLYSITSSNKMSYCCLGVEAEIAGNPNYPAFHTEYPMDINLELECMRLNDTEMLTFSQIADWLDDNVRGVIVE